MAINFAKDTVETSATPVDVASGVENQLVPVTQATTVATNSLLDQKKRFEDEIRKSGIVDRLTSEIVISEPATITNFGREAADELGKVGDKVIQKYDPKQLAKTGSMMGTLTAIMDEIDISEITEEEKKGLAKLFGRAKMNIDQILKKYNTVGAKLEKVCGELRVYEKEIEDSNRDLAMMYDAELGYYKTLIGYIIAGEDAIRQVDEYLAELEAKKESTGDPSISLEINNVTQAKQLLEQRVQDLRIADTVALQSIPRLKSMEFTNWNLARKINSSFIITIPLFKDAIAQAMIMKQQKLQSESLKALDAKTNELMLRNAQMAANNMRDSAMLSGSSAIKVETVEKTWQILLQGITDTKQLQADISKQREADKKAIEEANNKYMRQISVQ